MRGGNEHTKTLFGNHHSAVWTEWARIFGRPVYTAQKSKGKAIKQMGKNNYECKVHREKG
jgi:hypothetical protein